VLEELDELRPHLFDAVDVRRSRRCRREIRRLLRRGSSPVAIEPLGDERCTTCLRAVGVVPATGEAGPSLEVANRLAAAGDARVDLLRVSDAVPPWLVVLSASSPWVPPYVDARTAAALATDGSLTAGRPADVFVRCASGCPKAAVVAFSRSVDLLVVDASRVQIAEAALRAAVCPLVLVPADLRVHRQRALALA
jgi:hypothetical protein